MTKKGKFIVVDGIDGVGKGVFLDTFVREAKKDGKKVFDVHQFWKSNDFHPLVHEIQADIIVTSEPTYGGIGKTIREELIAKNQRNYSPQAVAQAYALDRLILYENLILPLLERGIDVYQSRSFSTSLVYQRQSAIDNGEIFSPQEILQIPGNKFCLQRPMDHLVVPTINNAQEAQDRIKNREKDDNCKFENLDFQLKIKEQYESEDFQRIFQDLGVPITYMDAGISIEDSERQAVKFYNNHLR
jgi:thymidylate kinase